MKNEIEITIGNCTPDTIEAKYVSECSRLGVTDEHVVTSVTVVSVNPIMRDLKYHGHIRLTFNPDKVVMNLMNEVYDRTQHDVIYRFTKQIEMNSKYILMMKVGFATDGCPEWIW